MIGREPVEGLLEVDAPDNAGVEFDPTATTSFAFPGRKTRTQGYPGFLRIGALRNAGSSTRPLRGLLRMTADTFTLAQDDSIVS